MFFPSMVPLPNFWVISVWNHLASEVMVLFPGSKWGANEPRSPRSTLVQFYPSFPHPQFDFTLSRVKFGHSWNLIIYTETKARLRLRQGKMVDLMAFVLWGKLLQGPGSSSSSHSGGATSLPFIFELVTNSENAIVEWLKRQL